MQYFSSHVFHNANLQNESQPQLEISDSVPRVWSTTIGKPMLMYQTCCQHCNTTLWVLCFGAFKAFTQGIQVHLTHLQSGDRAP